MEDFEVRDWLDRGWVLVRFWTILAAVLVYSAASYAQDTGYFLSGKYTSDKSPQKRCDAERDEGNYLVLDRDGIRNFALSCDFITFNIRPGDFVTHIVVASCGDDSGVTRGDLITLIPETDGRIRVQSQNEYVASEISGGNYKPVVSGVYARCN